MNWAWVVMNLLNAISGVSSNMPSISDLSTPQIVETTPKLMICPSKDNKFAASDIIKTGKTYSVNIKIQDADPNKITKISYDFTPSAEQKEIILKHLPLFYEKISLFIDQAKTKSLETTNISAKAITAPTKATPQITAKPNTSTSSVANSKAISQVVAKPVAITPSSAVSSTSSSTSAIVSSQALVPYKASGPVAPVSQTTKPVAVARPIVATVAPTPQITAKPNTSTSSVANSKAISQVVAKPVAITPSSAVSSTSSSTSAIVSSQALVPYNASGPVVPVSQTTKPVAVVRPISNSTLTLGKTKLDQQEENLKIKNKSLKNQKEQIKNIKDTRKISLKTKIKTVKREKAQKAKEQKNLERKLKRLEKKHKRTTRSLIEWKSDWKENPSIKKLFWTALKSINVYSEKDLKKKTIILENRAERQAKNIANYQNQINNIIVELNKLNVKEQSLEKEYKAFKHAFKSENIKIAEKKLNYKKERTELDNANKAYYTNLENARKLENVRKVF